MARAYEITVDVQMLVECSKCGSSLEITDSIAWNGEHTLEVQPCAQCIADAEQAVHEDAENEAE